MVLYIIGLPNDDPFFTKFGKERDRFLDEFKQAGIKSLNPKNVADDKEVSIKSCKQWADSDSKEFKKYLTYYADHLEGREAFVAEFFGKVNQLLVKSGLPPVAIE